MLVLSEFDKLISMKELIDDPYSFSIQVKKLNDEIQKSDLPFDEKIKLIDKFNEHYKNTTYHKLCLMHDIEDWKKRFLIKNARNLKDIKVSIVLPIYNKVEYGLHRGIQSCINQTHKNIEIICVNDASTDGTLKVLEYFAKIDSRVVVVNLQKNRKCSGARIAGWEISTGDYVVNFDPDDWMDDNYIEKMLEFANDVDIDIIEYDFAGYIGDREAVYYGSVADFLYNIEKWDSYRFCVRVWGKLYKKEVIEKSLKTLKDKITVNIPEDIFLHIYVLKNAKTVCSVNIDSHYYYETNHDSITSNFNFKHTIETQHTLNALIQEYNSYYAHRNVEFILHLYRTISKERNLYTEKEILSKMDSELLSIMLNIAWERLDSYDYEIFKYKSYKLDKVLSIINYLKDRNPIIYDLAKVYYKSMKSIYKLLLKVFCNSKNCLKK